MATARCLPLLLSRSPKLQLRTMASSARKHEFLVIVPDKPGTHAKRLQVRPYAAPPPFLRRRLSADFPRSLHLKNMTPRVESGTWKMGGPLAMPHLSSLPSPARDLGHNANAHKAPCSTPYPRPTTRPALTLPAARSSASPSPGSKSSSSCETTYTLLLESGTPKR